MGRGVGLPGGSGVRPAVKPGNVALVYFPFNRTEAQPYKKRPVLVLNAMGSGDDRAILVAMITSNLKRYQNPSAGDIRITDFKTAGLVCESTVRSRRLWTAEDRDIEKTLGVVPPDVLTDALAFVRSIVEAKSPPVGPPSVGR